MLLGIVNKICGIVGYFSLSTQISQIRKVGRSVHDQDIVPEQWRGFQQSNILHETAKRMTWWQDTFWEHIVQKYPEIERGKSASETHRKHIPPRIFKEMTRLTKQKEKLEAMLADVKLTNYKSQAAQILAFLDKYIPDVEAMDTEMKKYRKEFAAYDAEKKALKAENKELTAELEKSKKQSATKKVKELKLQSDYAEVRAILDRIPPEIIRAYAQRGKQKEGVAIE